MNEIIMPKMGDVERCRHCGRCMLGCPHGRKWDSRSFLDEAGRRGARLVTLLVGDRNTAARQLYEGMGFAPRAMFLAGTLSFADK